MIESSESDSDGESHLTKSSSVGWDGGRPGVVSNQPSLDLGSSFDSAPTLSLKRNRYATGEEFSQLSINDSFNSGYAAYYGTYGSSVGPATTYGGGGGGDYSSSSGTENAAGGGGPFAATTTTTDQESHSLASSASSFKANFSQPRRRSRVREPDDLGFIKVTASTPGHTPAARLPSFPSGTYPHGHGHLSVPFGSSNSTAALTTSAAAGLGVGVGRGMVRSVSDTFCESGGFSGRSSVEREETPGPGDRATAASPSWCGETLENMQLYLLIARCIAYPFNAKFQFETSPPKPKMDANNFSVISNTIRSLLDSASGGKLDQSHLPEVHVPLSSSEYRCVQTKDFRHCLRWFNDNVLSRKEVEEICKSGGFSLKEFDNIFRMQVTNYFTYMTACAAAASNTSSNKPDAAKIDTFCGTFSKIIGQTNTRRLSRTSDVRNPSAASEDYKDKLYLQFQKILGVSPKDHLFMYRECQLGNAEEQEAVVRRELQRRIAMFEDDKTPLGFFGSHKVEKIYRDEQLKVVKKLMESLDQLTLPTQILTPERRKKFRVGDKQSETASFVNVSKKLLKVKITIHEAIFSPVPVDIKPVFCVFELLDQGSTARATAPQTIDLQTGAVTFEEKGHFETHALLPQVRFTLRAEVKSFLSLKEDKIYGKQTITVTPVGKEVLRTIEIRRSGGDGGVVGRLKVSAQMEKPGNMKKCGNIYCSSDSHFKQWTERFLTLSQLSEYKFVLCGYQPRDSVPRDHLLLEGFLVEFLTKEEEEKAPRGRDNQPLHYFKLHSETSSILFGCSDEKDHRNWVQWVSRATGQGDEVLKMQSAQREFPTGIVELVNMDVVRLDHMRFFYKLFQLVLDYRMRENVFSRGLFSPAQMYVMDEYCERYGVQPSFRHLTCLQLWLQMLKRGESIWPTMMYSSYRFVQMHVGGAKPLDKSVIVTKDEQRMLMDVSCEMEEILSYRIENFHKCFPFGQPKEDLLNTIKLYKLVVSVYHSRSSEKEIMGILATCLERAALINYKGVFQKLMDKHKDELKEGEYGPLGHTLLHELAELCIDFMYEIHEYFCEDFKNCEEAFSCHSKAFWSFYLVDMRESLMLVQDVIPKLKLFNILNSYFCSQPTMNLGCFHCSLLDEFAPVIEEYMDSMEELIKCDVLHSFSLEKWLPVSDTCCLAVEGMIRALDSVKRLLDNLRWPDKAFASKMESRVEQMCSNMFQLCVELTEKQLKSLMGPVALDCKSHLPLQCFTMLNTIVHLNSQMMPFCCPKSQTRNVQLEKTLQDALNSTIAIVIDKLCHPLSLTLKKVSSYDATENVFSRLATFFSGGVSIPDYEKFMSESLKSVSDHLVKTIFNNFIMNWYEFQLQQVEEWLKRRPTFSLQLVQNDLISNIVQVVHENFSEFEMTQEQLQCNTFLTVQDRLRMENSQVDLLGKR